MSASPCEAAPASSRNMEVWKNRWVFRFRRGGDRDGLFSSGQPPQGPIGIRDRPENSANWNPVFLLERPSRAQQTQTTRCQGGEKNLRERGPRLSSRTRNGGSVQAFGGPSINLPLLGLDGRVQPRSLQASTQEKTSANGTRSSWGEMSGREATAAAVYTGARTVAAYRFRIWNGSLGNSDVSFRLWRLPGNSRGS